MSPVLQVDAAAPTSADLAEAVDHLRAGGVLAYPTETVYGLGGAIDPGPVARVLEIKGRQPDRPLLVLLPSRESADGLRWTPAARRLADAFWPGALTLVLADPQGIFPKGVRSPWTGGVGVRVSPNPVACGLVEAFGRPLTSTSLNVAGGAPARSGAEAVTVARALAGDEILVIDVGPLPPSAASTLVDCTADVPVVLRAGSLPVEELRRVTPEIHERARD